MAKCKSTSKDKRLKVAKRMPPLKRKNASTKTKKRWRELLLYQRRSNEVDFQKFCVDKLCIG